MKKCIKKPGIAFAFLVGVNSQTLLSQLDFYRYGIKSLQLWICRNKKWPLSPQRSGAAFRSAIGAGGVKRYNVYMEEKTRSRSTCTPRRLCR